MAASTASGVKPTTSACSWSTSRRSSSEICLSSFGTTSFNTLATSVSIALLLLSICLSPLRATTTGTALSALFSKEGMITRLSHGLINIQSLPPACLMIWRVTHSPGRAWGGSLSLTLPCTALVCEQSPLQVTVMSLICSSEVLVTKSTRMCSSTGRPNGRKAAKKSKHPRRIAWNIYLPLQYQLGGFVSSEIVSPYNLRQRVCGEVERVADGGEGAPRTGRFIQNERGKHWVPPAGSHVRTTEPGREGRV